MENALKISMLGQFAIRAGENCVDDSSNRMRKVWLLLAYLIYSRNSRSGQTQFVSLLRGSGNGEIEDPSGRLKALFYRARTQLNHLWENAGHELILYKGGTYGWNTDIPIELDVEIFDRLCREAALKQDEACKLQTFMQALTLYQGDFLDKLSMEPWVMPINAYYHQMYLDAVQQTLKLLEDRGSWGEASDLCGKALEIEPYSEELYGHLMRCRIAMGDRAGAVRAYEEMSELLFETFGVMPSEESRALYREASREVGTVEVPVGTVREQLREAGNCKGAIFCEYDFFRMLYQVQARSIVRSGDVVHIALLSVHGEEQKELSRRSLDCAMENLQSITLDNLRSGDVVSRCSISQLILLLPNANYENSGKVCQRIIRAFYRQYPHSPAQIRFSVQPLEPRLPPVSTSNQEER